MLLLVIVFNLACSLSYQRTGLDPDILSDFTLLKRFVILILRCAVNKLSLLSLQEVKANSVVFLIGGYETLSNLLAYVAYEMAINPQYQLILQQELDEAFPDEVRRRGSTQSSLAGLILMLIY